MQVIGFNLTKILGEKTEHAPKLNVNAEIQFINLEKQKVDILKDSEAIKLSFKHGLNYKKQDNKGKDIGEIIFEGNISLSVDKEESKEIMKSWKKKQLPQNATIFLYNFILKKCAPRSLAMQEELGLPSHIKIPRLDIKQEQ